METFMLVVFGVAVLLMLLSVLIRGVTWALIFAAWPLAVARPW